jgi:hypothetical protein
MEIDILSVDGVLQRSRWPQRNGGLGEVSFGHMFAAADIWQNPS